MKIISLVESTTKSELKAKQGLSLYIETKTHKILFDLGPDKTLIDYLSHQMSNMHYISCGESVEIPQMGTHPCN